MRSASLLLYQLRQLSGRIVDLLELFASSFFATPRVALNTSAGGVLSSVLLLVTCVHATEGEMIFVTAESRLVEEQYELKTLELIAQEDLVEKGFRTVPESFGETAGVHVQKTTHGHGSPYIRGFTGRQNVLMVDGVRLNNSTWRSGPIQYWNTVDSYNVEGVELLKGVGSVLYGSDALGGVVNIRTQGLGAEISSAEDSFSHGKLNYRYESGSVSQVGRVSSSIGQGGETGWGLQLGVTAKDYGDIRDHAIHFKNTGYPEQNVDVKFEKLFGEDLKLTVAHQYVNQDDVWRWHNTEFNDVSWVHGSSYTDTGSDYWRVYDQERSLSCARLEGGAEQAWLQDWSATLSYQNTQDSEDRYRFTSGEHRRDLKHLDVETFGVAFKAKAEFDYGSLFYGLDSYYDSVSSEGRRIIYASRYGVVLSDVERASNRPVADDSSYWSTGVHIQPTLDLNDALRLQLGARYSDIRTEWEGFRPDGASSDQSGESSWQNFSKSLRLAQEFQQEWIMTVGYSEGFRAPNLDDLTGKQFVQSGLLSNGSPDLEPEHYQSYELSALYSGARLQFGVNIFYSDLDDTIVRVEDGAGDLYSVNAGEGITYGYEVTAEYQLTHAWSMGGYASNVWGRIQQPRTLGGALEESHFSKLPPFQAGVYTRYADLSKPWWVELIFKGANKADDLSTNELNGNDDQRIPYGGTPSYVIGTLRGGYSVNDQLSLNLALENLGDVDYRAHGSGVNGGRFNATVGVDWQW